jgi:hypothetical protein|tara:strand:- start:8427 stop:8537 length:111 start_codon:yes stop_codon:yes gene_type:complete
MILTRQRDLALSRLLDAEELEGCGTDLLHQAHRLEG